ncbi:MAG: ATP synthase F1 subunit gamma [Selenomonadales bacterium]|nr:ATP synthase F1 subunit gamma [Selenomonadales bacterium]
MPSAQDIKRRIKGVVSTQQITKAMKMVATARLRRAQEMAGASLPYADKLRAVLASLAASNASASHPLMEVREDKRQLFIVLSADKGLAGAYMSNLVKEVAPRITTATPLVVVGRRCVDYFKRRNYHVLHSHIGFSEKPTYDHAKMLAKEISHQFLQGQCDEIYLAYTKFYSPIKVEPMIVKLLPLDEMLAETQGAPQGDYLFEPSPEEVLAVLLPKYLEMTIYAALLQSAASELGARMTAMGSATDNAEELISQLTLYYNQVRQAAITNEISEIVGGADALK